MPVERFHRQRDRRSNDPGYTKRVNEAIEGVMTGKYVSWNDAQRQTGVPKSTMLGRAKGNRDTWANASAKQQILSPEQEGAILDWCRHRASMGTPYSAADIRAKASAISGKEVGKKWHKKFENRHPELRTAKPSKLDPKRAKHFNEAVIGNYFDQMEELHSRYTGGIPPKHLWNMDEKGVQMGGGRKKTSKKYYYLKDQKQRYRISSDNLELVTIIECISAAGDVVPPSFCLQNGSRPDLRDLDDSEWGSIYFSESGWTDDYNCEKWLSEVFIPFAKEHRSDPSKPIVLTMDGHGSHETPGLQRVVYKHLDEEDLEIIIFCFPSKVTHKCQPLDVAVFSSVERSWQEVCDRCIKENTPINRFSVIPQYVRGTRGAMTKELIAKAFKMTGLYPVDRNVFKPEDFAPSKVSSTVAHVPSSFPAEVPGSDPIEPPADVAEDSDSDDEEYDPSMPEAVEGEQNSLEGGVADSEMDSASDSNDSDDDRDGPRGGSDTETIQGDTPETVMDINDNEEGDNTTSDHDDGPSLTHPSSGLMVTLVKIETDLRLTRSATLNSDLYVQVPKVVSLEEDLQRHPEELLDQLRSVRQQLVSTYQALRRAMSQLSAANSHCTVIQHELGEVRVQLDNATKKKTRGSTKIQARFLTSKNMRAEFDREDAERQEKERVAAEKGKLKEADAAARAHQLADDAMNRSFSGKIKNYKKDDLRALALALKLSDLGNKDELNKRIDKHFEDHPADKEIPRFAALFQPSTTGRGRRQATPPPPPEEQLGNERNEPPPPTASGTVTVFPNNGSQAGAPQHPNPYIYQYPHHYSQYYYYTSSTPSTSTGTANAIPNPLHYYTQGNHYGPS